MTKYTFSFIILIECSIWMAASPPRYLMSPWICLSLEHRAHNQELFKKAVGSISVHGHKYKFYNGIKAASQVSNLRAQIYMKSIFFLSETISEYSILNKQNLMEIEKICS